MGDHADDALDRELLGDNYWYEDNEWSFDEEGTPAGSRSKHFAPQCFCGSTSSLRSNSILYDGKEYGNGKAWICDRFPGCRGSVGTHPDGTPLGTIADGPTRYLRALIHSIVDPLWKEGPYSRGEVYAWLARIYGKPVHMGKLDLNECMRLIKRIAIHSIQGKR